MRLFLPAFCLLSILTLPASADPASPPPARPSSLRSDILYTHKGEFVQVSPMRPLTLNAHVEQFQYDPQGWKSPMSAPSRRARTRFTSSKR